MVLFIQNVEVHGQDQKVDCNRKFIRGSKWATGTDTENKEVQKCIHNTSLNLVEVWLSFIRLQDGCHHLWIWSPLLIASFSEITVRFTTATFLCCIFWSCILLLFCLKDCKISAQHPYMYIIPIISDILRHHTYIYNVLVLLCDNTIHPITRLLLLFFFAYTNVLFFCCYCFNLSLLFIQQYSWSVCIPVLCHQTSIIP